MLGEVNKKRSVCVSVFLDNVRLDEHKGLEYPGMHQRKKNAVGARIRSHRTLGLV